MLTIAGMQHIFFKTSTAVEGEEKICHILDERKNVVSASRDILFLLPLLLAFPPGVDIAPHSQ